MSPRGEEHNPLGSQLRGTPVGTALLVEFYRQLPEPREGDTPKGWARRLEAALAKFKKHTAARYTEGPLQRLLEGALSVETRRAAGLALGMLGTMAATPEIAARLHDEDEMVRSLAADALWSIWFRADTTANNQELQRLM